MKGIEVRTAEVKTAAVEIKTLSVSGKQMTLALFRQLKKEAIHDPDSRRRRGEPWGLVNYFWGDCASWNHLHVVWQKGNELRRACVGSKCPWNELKRISGQIEREEDLLRDLCRLILCEEALAGRRIPHTERQAAVKVHAYDYVIRWESRLSPVFDLLWSENNPSWECYRQTQAARWRDNQRVIIDGVELTGDPLRREAAGSAAELARLRCEARVLQQQWDEEYGRLLALDHLFIAV